MDTKSTQGWNERNHLCLGSLETKIVSQKEGSHHPHLIPESFASASATGVTWDMGMDGFLAGHKLSLFLWLCAGADMGTHVQGPHSCPGLHKGLAGRCRGTWCTGPVPRLRAAGRAMGWRRRQQPSGRKNYVHLLKKSPGHKKQDSRTAQQTKIPTRACCSPQAGGGAWLCMEAEVAVRVFFSFFFQLESHLLQLELSVNHTPWDIRRANKQFLPQRDRFFIKQSWEELGCCV